MTALQLLKMILPELTGPLAMASLYGTIALALLTCFFGFRLRHLWYALLIFGVGALLGYAVSRLFVPDRVWLCVLIGLGVGAVAAAFTFRITQAVVFVLAFGCVFSLVGEVLGDLYPVAAVIAAVVLGVIAGVLAARFHRWVIILVTGVSGGWRAASLLGRAVPSMTAQTVLIVAGALAAAGIIFQFVTTRKLAK